MSARRGGRTSRARQSKHNLGLVLAGNEVHFDVTPPFATVCRHFIKAAGSCGETDTIRLLGCYWENRVPHTHNGAGGGKKEEAAKHKFVSLIEERNSRQAAPPAPDHRQSPPLQGAFCS